MSNANDDCAVKIAVRERPARDDLPESSVITYHPTSKNVLVVDERPFVFDVVFAPDVTQKELFETLIQPMVGKAMKGFNCTALAYGQTGTGKTFTMGLQTEESFEDEYFGIIPRCLEKVFEFSRDTNESSKVDISASFIEIYNEKVYDMLSENPFEQINIKGHKFLGGLKRPIQNVEEGYDVLIQGNKNRHVRPTKMNPQSSRSHAVFTLHTVISSPFKTLSSCFHLVDLAGSEGVRRTGHQGVALTEGVHINQGLLSIGKVLQALVSESKVIPYRDSVLSSVLQDSLNINSYLTLLACISPHKDDLSETLSTLRFAQNAKSLRNTPQINSLLSEIKKPKNRTPLKGFALPLRSRNGQFVTPLLGKHKLASNQGLESSTKRKKVFHSNTFCTPSKIRKVEIGKFNQTDFGLTPNEKQKRAQQQNRPIRPHPLENQFNDYRTRGLNDSIDSSSMLSLNVSTSTALEVPVTHSYSPIVNKFMVEFETRLENKIQKIMDALKEMNYNTTNNLSVKEAPASSDISKEFIKQELRTIVQEEILSLNETQAIECAQESYHLRCQLFPENSPIFKIPNAPVEHTMMESNSSCTFLQDGSKTVLTRPRRSTRLSLKSKESRFDITPARRRTTSSLKSRDNILERTHVRRSARLSAIAHKEENQEKDASVESLPTKAKRTREGPTENKVIAEYFRNRNAQVLPITNIQEAKSKHQKAILELLNTGSIKELQILPHIGLKTAYQIVTHRTLNGKFKNFEQVSKTPVWRGKAWERFREANNIS